MTATHTITVVRIFDASPKELYNAWTEPSFLRRWFGEKVEADVYVGGHYRVEHAGENGDVHAHEGHYEVLEPGRRIRKTFAYVGTGVTEPTGYTNEFVDITLREISPGRTELTLTNGWSGKAMPPDEQSASEEGWEFGLDRLREVLQQR